MNTTGNCGRIAWIRSAISRPFISGISMSVSSRSICRPSRLLTVMPSASLTPRPIPKTRVSGQNLIKKKGVWFLTPEGDSALKLGEDGLLGTAQKKYREWRLKNPRQAEVPETEIAIVEEVAKEEQTSADEIEESAYEQIENYINKKNPYEFQDLAAALLRGMGYFTPFVAPAGKDGGVDIVAYRDPLGTSSPRIKVQIKHRETSATVQEVRQLMGLLQKDGDVGIFISSGGFTSEAKATARNSNVHVELVDLPRFITLWQEFYQKLPDEDKTKLPLFPIYLLATTT